MANRPGQLAALARRLGDAGVHIEALAAFAAGEAGIVRFVSDDDASARKVLADAGLDYDEHRVIATMVPNQPGALAAMTESLAHTGVNIDAMYLLHTDGDHQQFALAVSDLEVAVEYLAV